MRWASARFRSPVSCSEPVDGLVDHEVAARAARQQVEDPTERSSGPAPATSEVVRMAPALISGLSGRPVPGCRLMALNPSPLGSTPTRAEHLLGAHVGQGQGVDEGLRDRLDGEGDVGLPGLVARAGHADQGEPEVGRVGRRQLGDVVGHRASSSPANSRRGSPEQVADRVEGVRRLPSPSLGRPSRLEIALLDGRQLGDRLEQVLGPDGLEPRQERRVGVDPGLERVEGAGR